jgi:hypothetical protein
VRRRTLREIEADKDEAMVERACILETLGVFGRLNAIIDGPEEDIDMFLERTFLPQSRSLNLETYNRWKYVAR